MDRPDALTAPRVAEIMTRAPLATLRPDDTLERAALELMRSEVRHLPVVDRGGRLVGILSQRDLAAASPDLHGRARDLMSPDVISVAPETPAHEAAYLLLRHPIGCVPVSDARGRLVGMLTATDFVRVAYALLGGAVPVDQLETEEMEAERVA
jgi:acetoin utilization protein AcuB